MASLLVHDDNGDRTVPLLGSITIGRHSKNKVVLHASGISKQHAVIRCLDKTYVYEDLNSSNGSHINEIRFSKHTLVDGDVISIGHVRLTFQDSSVMDDISRLVTFDQFDAESTQYQERIELTQVERFLPEREVADLSMLRVDYEKLRMGNELLQSIGTERNLKTLLDSISSQLIRMFMADRCVILLLNAANEFEAKSVQSMDAMDGPIAVSQSVLKEVQSSKSAVLLSDAAQNDYGQESSLMMMGIQSVMCSPIIHESKVIGAVHVDLRNGQGSFTKKDLQLLGGIVTYIAMAVINAGLSRKIEQEAKMQAQFERLLSPSVVKQLVAGKIKLDKSGETRHVTIMFADIRGFTRMSQKATPKAVVFMLNQYFERVVNIIFKYGGTVDKFIGDEVMVLFGAPIPMDHQEDAALACALEIQQMLKQWNLERHAKKKGMIPVGIGINSGEVVVGSIGSSQTMQYTCVGNAVNIASRLTGLAKAGEVVASKDTMQGVHAKTKCEALSPANIKGLDGKLQAYLVKAIAQSDSYHTTS
ncbi:MAG: adenylate/guanylate cyclase domain-containing protein [Mariprofundaceae bacterium]|nr:adenylate/guanylate cyclase domain-containing protein [Mariprofundaceae bacterium]